MDFLLKPILTKFLFLLFKKNFLLDKGNSPKRGAWTSSFGMRGRPKRRRDGAARLKINNNKRKVGKTNNR